MTHLMPPPFILVEGVRNFRDFGAYPTQSGRTVAKHKLFRSANYAQMTNEGRAQLAELGVKTIVDLRRRHEREQQPSQFHGLDVEVVTSSLGEDDTLALPPHLEFIRDTDLTLQATHDHMLRAYRRIPWEPQHIQLFKETFDRLARHESPLVIHCAAGKDRTGILCGLILHALGVDYDTILADYLLTNQVARDMDMIARYARQLSLQFNKVIEPATLAPMIGVHEDFLSQAWSHMDKREGGVDGYLARLGIDQAFKARLAESLLV
ncbi:tyrosine-protein phosphatase [Candidatus Phycosocius spiralis]|uniref:Protein-tyrosine-phosphatase n=1 Tax=Candidatus Phycosocius spiralis TaxID=2815099 RepID=A0ABQ4PU52_9PROT|nr:tyrosine-protein phosphatase [Candidatus Phycosocius spiralis]GIU66524.1 protein-tyrosine-phosphatase [Candidatus Phycosocius spiralis]